MPCQNIYPSMYLHNGRFLDQVGKYWNLLLLASSGSRRDLAQRVHLSALGNKWTSVGLIAAEVPVLTGSGNNFLPGLGSVYMYLYVVCISMAIDSSGRRTKDLNLMFDMNTRTDGRTHAPTTADAYGGDLLFYAGVFPPMRGSSPLPPKRIHKQSFPLKPYPTSYVRM